MTKTIRRLGLAGALAGLAGLAASPALAQVPPYPWWNFYMGSALNYVAEDNEGSDDTQNLYLQATPNAQILPWDGVILNASGVLTDFPPAGDDSFFEYEDFFIDDIDLTLTDWVWTGQFGKTQVPFGLAWYQTPGFFGSNFVDDYDYDQRIVARGAYDLGHLIDGGTWGRHQVNIGSFFVDTTFLSQSVFGELERVRLSDGGPGNTEGFDSYFVTLDGTDVPVLRGVDYRVGYVYNAAGLGDTGHEQGVSVGAVTTVPLVGQDALSTARGEYTALNLIAEYARLNNFGGTAGVDHDYWTGGAELWWRTRWFGSASTTLRQVEMPGAGNSDDWLFQASAGYQFHFRSQFQIGYGYEEIGGLDSHMIGVQFTHTFQVGDLVSLWPTFGKPARVLTNTQLNTKYANDRY